MYSRLNTAIQGFLASKNQKNAEIQCFFALGVKKPLEHSGFLISTALRA
jgi:hypothetical protein